jgi:hypothetical protein
MIDTPNALVAGANELPAPTTIPTTDWSYHQEYMFDGQKDIRRQNECRSRESNTGLVHGKHEFYH